MSMSNYLEDKILSHISNQGTYTPPAKLYLALFTTPSVEGIGQVEVSKPSYVRKEIIFAPPMSGNMGNIEDVVFNIATEDWGIVKGVGVYDAVTGGNILFQTTLTTEQNITIDNQLVFKAGRLSIRLD